MGIGRVELTGSQISHCVGPTGFRESGGLWARRVPRLQYDKFDDFYCEKRKQTVYNP
jgi:hypothetical protein